MAQHFIGNSETLVQGQQVISGASGDPDLCPHIASPCHDELNNDVEIILSPPDVYTPFYTLLNKDITHICRINGSLVKCPRSASGGAQE